MGSNSVRISAALDDKVSGPLDRIRDKFDTIGGKGTAASFFGNFAAGAVAAGIGAVAGAVSGVTTALGESIGKASDFNESLSKVSVVFGPSSKAIQDFAKTADVSLGLSETAALGFAGTFGNLFTNLKLGQPVAADMSKNLISLGGDLASFNNIETTDALDKLRAGLAGEAEPLRTLGVFLTEAKVKAEAMALGLVKGNAPLTEAAKVQARYSLILKETTLAQGDFSRTSDGMANQTRINAARMENAWTRVGQGLLPIANTIMPMVADAMVVLVEGIGSVITGIQKFVSENKLLFDVLGAIAGLIGTVLVAAFQQLATNVSTVFTIVSTVVGGVFDVIKGVVSGIIGAIRNVMGVAAEIPGPWQEGAKQVKASLDAMQANVEGFGRSTVDRMERDGAAIPTALAKPIAAGAGTVQDAAEEGIGDPLTAATAAGAAKAVAIARKTPSEMASALRDKREAWQGAIDQLKDDLANKMTTAAEIAGLKAALAGDEIRKGLKSKDPVVKAQAEATVGIIRARLIELSEDTGRWGTNAGANFARGIRSTAQQVAAAAAYVAAAAARNLEVRSPAKEGPLSRGGPEVWGAKIGTSLAAGMVSAVGAVRSGAVALAGAAIPGMGTSNVAYGGTLRGSVAGSGGGGDTLNVTFQTLTLPSAAQAEELERLLTPIVVNGFQKRRLMQRVGTA